MRDSFPKALRFTLKKEGGFSNNPKDPGGPTFKGVCARDYPHLLDKIMARNISDDEAANLVYLPIWIKAGCDALPYPLDCVTFDMAVNMGNVRGRDAAADAHVITDHLDGLFAALGAPYGASELFPQAWPYLAAASHVAERIGEYNIMGGRPGFRDFRDGWRNRAFDSLKTFL